MNLNEIQKESLELRIQESLKILQQKLTQLEQSSMRANTQLEQQRAILLLLEKELCEEPQIRMKKRDVRKRMVCVINGFAIISLYGILIFEILGFVLH